jgi:hypothetical protein
MAEKPSTNVNGEYAPDLVVIDRKAIKQLLYAVVNALQASHNLERAGQEGVIDPLRQEDMRNRLNEARQSLVDSISKLVTSLDDLPRVELNETSQESKPNS